MRGAVPGPFGRNRGHHRVPAQFRGRNRRGRCHQNERAQRAHPHSGLRRRSGQAAIGKPPGRLLRQAFPVQQSLSVRHPLQPHRPAHLSGGFRGIPRRRGALCPRLRRGEGPAHRPHRPARRPGYPLPHRALFREAAAAGGHQRDYGGHV